VLALYVLVLQLIVSRFFLLSNRKLLTNSIRYCFGTELLDKLFSFGLLAVDAYGAK